MGNISKKQWDELLRSISQARCPVCGCCVFLPMKCFREMYDKDDDLSNPIVFCIDMGHWAGHLSECVFEDT